jgi:hypothetical protein
LGDLADGFVGVFGLVGGVLVVGAFVAGVFVAEEAEELLGGVGVS